ncbi:MAG: S1C family serine protease [Pseudomonadales bacterium]
MSKLVRFLAWPVIAGVLAGLLLINNRPTLTGQDDQPATIVLASLAPAAEHAAPSVVNIYTSKTIKTRRHPLLDDPFVKRFRRGMTPPRQERVKGSLGSGVILRSNGYIVTNNHVISGADEIQVLFANGTTSLANIVGADPESDLAVLKVDFDNLPSIELGEPEQARIGDIVLAIGNPYGLGQTVTQGIISATGRYGLRLNTFENYIQTDAAINPGNSGGALIDTNGKLLGINSAIYSKSGGSQGIGLAIPANTVTMVSDDLIEYGRVQRGWLGIEVRDWSPQLAAALNLPPDVQSMVVTGINPNGPAARTRLRQGDLLIAIGGTPVNDAYTAMNMITAQKPGSEITLTVNRLGDEQELVATMDIRP